MKIGDRVRVAVPLKVYHHPNSKGSALDIQGYEGEIIALVTEWKGRPVGANFPFLVQFEGKFRGHFRDTELEVIGEAQAPE